MYGLFTQALTANPRPSLNRLMSARTRFATGFMKSGAGCAVGRIQKAVLARLEENLHGVDA